MKNNWIKKIAAAASVVCLASMAQATPITGNIGFSGAVDMNSTSVNSATEVTSWLNTVAASPSGSFVGIVNNGDAVAMTGATPWSFNSGPLANFWSVDGFTFNLTSSSIVSQVGGFLNVLLAGSVSGNGFTTTAFDGSFQVADPASGGPETYTERLSFNSVPDGGTTVVLLGLGLLSLGLFRNKMLIA
jgi:VPDSG-CTERM motif